MPIEEMPSQGGTYYRDDKTGKLTRAPGPVALQTPPEISPAIADDVPPATQTEKVQK